MAPPNRRPAATWPRSRRARRTRAARTATADRGYKISGRKQWISNGGVADLYTILALAPGGPSWFVVEKGADGFSQNKPEDKHGIRASNTAALFLEDVYVDADRLVGGEEGKGLGPGPGCLWLHAPDGGRLWAGRGLGSAANAPSPIRRCASRPARRSAKNRATRTS